MTREEFISIYSLEERVAGTSPRMRFYNLKYKLLSESTFSKNTVILKLHFHFFFLCVCVSMQVCLFLPGAFLHVQTDVLCLSRAVGVSPLHLLPPSPPVSPPPSSSPLSWASVHRGHVGDTCTHRGTRSPYNLVVVTAGVVRELPLPPPPAPPFCPPCPPPGGRREVK